MMRFAISRFLWAVVLLSFICSCQPSRPKDVLSASQLEEVLHDYHLAQAMIYSNRMGERDESMNKAVESVLAKHGITQEVLDSSLSYYSHHIETLNEIYVHLNDRYSEEAKLLGIQHAARNDVGFSESGDTVNIWNESSFLVLTSAPLDCTRLYAFEADSSYHQKDRFRMKGNTRMLGTNDRRLGVVIGLMVTYENDSIQTQSRTISNNQDFAIELNCDSTLAIKRLNCYITQFTDSETPIILDNLQLLKMHRKQP